MKINKQIQQIQSKTETAQSLLKNSSFEVYKEDYLAQGKILNNWERVQGVG